MIGSDALNAIRAGVAAGRSYSAIAADLGISRGSVAGHVNRYCGDVPRPPKATPMKAPDPAPAAQVVEVSDVEPVIESVVIPFVVAEGCRWPLWSADDPLETKSVCGARCDGHVYCAGHDRLAHRETKRRAA